MVQTFIIRNWKSFLIPILILLAVLLFRWGNSQRIRANENANGRDAAIAISNGLQYKVATYQNELGNQVQVTKTIKTNFDNFKELVKMDQFRIQKSFNVKLKNIESATKFGTTTNLDSLIKSRFSGPLSNSDTIIRMNFSMPEVITKAHTHDSLQRLVVLDEWNNIDIYVTKSSKMEMRDKVTGIDERSRPKRWFWRLITFRSIKKESKYHLTNRNHLIKMDSIIHMEIKEK